MSKTVATPLKLTAMDRESLAAFSACLQDALTRVGEMVYRRKERRFVVTANRYMWEVDHQQADAQNGDALHYRIRTGFHINGVLGVQSQGLIQENPNGWVSLLAIELEGGSPEGPDHPDFDPDKDAGNMFLTLVFAAGGRIRMEVECLDCVMSDLDDAWVTRNKPDHEEIAPQ